MDLKLTKFRENNEFQLGHEKFKWNLLIIRKKFNSRKNLKMLKW